MKRLGWFICLTMFAVSCSSASTNSDVSADTTVKDTSSLDEEQQPDQGTSDICLDPGDAIDSDIFLMDEMEALSDDTQTLDTTSVDDTDVLTDDVGALADSGMDVTSLVTPVVAAGMAHTCMTLSNGTVQCFGYNSKGQLGDQTIEHKYVPVPVTGLPAPAIALAAGFLHTCALTNQGAVLCWGNNSLAQLGDGTKEERHTPVPVKNLGAGVSDIASRYYHTCALISGGSVECFGDNTDGQLGHDSTLEISTEPLFVPGLVEEVTAVTVGASHSCVLYKGGGVACFGGNAEAQLGDGTFESRSTPGAVVDLPPVISVRSGFLHTCALTSGGAVWCWGQGVKGQLGDGYLVTRERPVQVAGLPTGIVGIAMGAQYSCAWNTSGAYCWGANENGQLGNGESADSVVQPVAVTGLPGTIIQMTAGGWHTCVRLLDETMMCFGGNEYGQLGNNSTQDSFVPVSVL